MMDEHETEAREKVAALSPATRTFLANASNIEKMEELADADLISETFSLTWLSDLAEDADGLSDASSDLSDKGQT